MKTKNAIMFLFVSSLLFISCSEDVTSPKDEETNGGIGTLEFRMTVWNAEHSGGLKNIYSQTQADTHTVDIINTRHLIPKIEISTDEVKSGVSPADINWTVMYESSEEMLATDREITIELPVGKYVSFKLTQRNLMYWVCNFEGRIFEFPSFNDSELDPNAQLINYFGETGLHEIEGGVFVLKYERERLGSFEIKPNAKTKVTMRMNLITLDWIDNDGSGDWSDGDELTNWRTPEGITTMTDLIVEYE